MSDYKFLKLWDDGEDEYFYGFDGSLYDNSEVVTRSHLKDDLEKICEGLDDTLPLAFYGTHHGLASLLKPVVGEETMVDVMWAIVQKGGIDELC